MQPVTKSQVRARLAGVELTVVQLEQAHAETTYRRNPIIRNSVERARAELERAYEFLFQNEHIRAFETCAVAWLHANFGKQLLEAEAIEHWIGESDYLELTETKIPWESKARQYVNLLESDIASFSDRIEALKNDT